MDDLIPPIEIPLGSLSPESLTGVMEQFILREGTDYGLIEVSFHSKLERVKKQLASGDVKIVFDPTDESVTLLTKQQFKDRLALKPHFNRS